jgi:catechol 2,3-dioxygenase-like lactoylglutathione lyase family enzyme
MSQQPASAPSERQGMPLPGHSGRAAPQAHGPQLASVVVFVHDLDQSVDFYRELLRMEVTVRTSTAALLVSPNGFQVYMRAVGPRAGHPSGQVGTQYVIWTAGSLDDLHRCERVLKAWSAHMATKDASGFTLVEGRDPSGLPVMVAYPGPDEVARLEIIARYYV